MEFKKNVKKIKCFFFASKYLLNPDFFHTLYRSNQNTNYTLIISGINKMWRYVAGATKPNELKRKAGEKEYYMICSVCCDYANYGEQNQFTTGCMSKKLDSVTKHEKSKQHLKAVLINEAKQKSKSESTAAKIVETMNKNIIDKLEKMFRNCHAVVLQNRPITDYLWLCALDEMKGIDLGLTYRNKESAKCFIQAISNVELKSVSNLIEQSKFICVIGDGSTDVSVKEQDMWFVRFSVCGQVFVKFIGVEAVDKANAENIVNGLHNVVENNIKLEWNSFVRKLIAISCDGASVMVGCRGGVATLLRKEQPCILTLHCMAHRLELALKDT